VVGTGPLADRDALGNDVARVLVAALPEVDLPDLHRDPRGLHVLVVREDLARLTERDERFVVFALRPERHADLAEEPRHARTREAGGPSARLAVALDREVVLAGELLHVADPLEDRRRVQRTGAVARDPQRGGLESERFGVRVDRAGAVP